MRPLIITPEIKAKIAQQVAWANQPENWSFVAKDKEPPGHNPAFVMMLEVGFRVVYTHTVLKGRHYRHLSVSVDGLNYPGEIAALTIATFFGFTGGLTLEEMTLRPGPDWLIDVNKDERCMVIAQLLEKQKAP